MRTIGFWTQMLWREPQAAADWPSVQNVNPLQAIVCRADTRSGVFTLVRDRLYWDPLEKRDLRQRRLGGET
jgi:hypothetical protein